MAVGLMPPSQVDLALLSGGRRSHSALRLLAVCRSSGRRLMGEAASGFTLFSKALALIMVNAMPLAAVARIVNE